MKKGGKAGFRPDASPPRVSCSGRTVRSSEPVFAPQVPGTQCTFRIWAAIASIKKKQATHITLRFAQKLRYALLTRVGTFPTSGLE